MELNAGNCIQRKMNKMKAVESEIGPAKRLDRTV